MRVPGHAAVSATVELARAVLGDGRGSFVNAVLRRVAARDADEWIAEVAPDRSADPAGHLAVARSHPRWIVDAIRDSLGGSWDETEQFLAADNAPPEVALVARPGRATVEELAAAGALPGRWSPYAVRWTGPPGDLPAVREGRAGVQDEGSQLVALALAGAPWTARMAAGSTCAPGRAARRRSWTRWPTQRGASVVAAERQEHRAALVARVLGRSGRVVVADGRFGPWRAGAFDRVLADVPCTGLGALRRRPEARWRRRPADIAALAPLQRDLLGAALDAARPGGLVAYVTCSPHLAETRVVVSDVLRGRDDVERVDARPLLPGVPDLGPGPHVQLWPHVHGCDAMYLALLRRT